jgi:hypothetical protein
VSVNKSKPQTSQTTTSRPVTLQDVEGITIAGNEASSFALTDGGAIAGSLDLAGLTVEKAAALTLGLVAAQSAASRSALDFATQSASKGYEFAMSAGRSDIALIQDGGRGLLILAGIAAGAYVLSRWGVKK